MRTLLLHLGALLLGAVVSLAAVLVHRDRAGGLPLGLVLAILASYAVAWALRESPRPRTCTTYAVGWLVVFGVVAVGRPEGDFALASDAYGYILMASSLVLAVYAVAALSARPPGERRGAT